MASKWQLQRDLSTYENLKSSLKNLLSDLKTASTDASQIGITLDSHYTINEDGNKAIKRADKLSKDIKEMVDYISNTIIPAIDTKMQQVREEIRREEEREEERMRQARNRMSSFRW